MTDMNEESKEPQGVWLALLESQAARNAKTIKVIVACWLVSLVMMGSLFVCLINSSEEEVTTTTTEVAQEADNYGSNVFSHGDYYGSETDSQDD